MPRLIQFRKSRSIMYLAIASAFTLFASQADAQETSNQQSSNTKVDGKSKDTIPEVIVRQRDKQLHYSKHRSQSVH